MRNLHIGISKASPSPFLYLQHFLVLASLLWASHLLLLHGLPPGGLSYPPAQLLASSFFSCGLSTVLQTWMGSRLPLIQAPSLEFLIPALVLTNQKLPLTTKTPGNASLSLPLCSLTRSCHGLELWNTSLREAHPAHGGMLSAPGFMPDTPLLLEAIFNFNSHLYSRLPTPFGACPCGLCVVHLCLCGYECYPSAAV